MLRTAKFGTEVIRCIGVNMIFETRGPLILEKLSVVLHIILSLLDSFNKIEKTEAAIVPMETMFPRNFLFLFDYSNFLLHVNHILRKSDYYILTHLTKTIIKFISRKRICRHNGNATALKDIIFLLCYFVFVKLF